MPNGVVREDPLEVAGRQRGWRPSYLVRGLDQMIGGLMSLPSRAVRASEQMRTQGEYDPRPALETAMMGPMASFPMAAARGFAGDPSVLSTLYLHARPPGRMRPSSSNAFNLVNEEGRTVGGLETTYNPLSKDVHVDYISSNMPSPLERGSLAAESNWASQSIGPKDIRSLIMGLKHQFPEAESVSGFRVSGARKAAGDYMLMEDALMRLPQVSPERMEAYLAGRPPGPSVPQRTPERAQSLERLLRSLFEESSPPPPRTVYRQPIGPPSFGELASQNRLSNDEILSFIESFRQEAARRGGGG